MELPLKPSEAAALADLIFQSADGRPLNDEVRTRLGGRVAGLELTSMTPFMGSLQKDPIHSSAYYVAVDGASEAGGNPLLLRMALASSPSSAHFPDAVLIGRMRPGGGREIVVNAIPFAPDDHQNIRTFVDEIDRSFYPHEQGGRSALSVLVHRPRLAVPAAFDAFQTILKRFGLNWASITIGAETSRDEVYFTSLWAAVRAGWRGGYVLNLAPQEDLELPLAPATPEQLHERLQALKAEGDPPQLIAPKLPDYDAIAAFATVARKFNATLSFHLDGAADPQVLRQIGRCTSGRFNVVVDDGPGSRDEITARLISYAEELRA